MTLFQFNRVEIGDRALGESDAGDDLGAVWPGVDDGFVHGAAVERQAIGAIVFDDVDAIARRDDQVGRVWVPL